MHSGHLIGTRSASNDIWSTWAVSPHDRVLAILADHTVPVGIRALARLAAVSPSTALRVAEEAVRQKRAVRGRLRGSRETLVLLKDDARRELRRRFPLPLRGDSDRLAFLQRIGRPVWILHEEDYAEYAVPRRIPTFVVMPRSWQARVPLPHATPVVFFERARPLEFTSLDQLPESELFVALLRLDERAARYMYDGLDASPVARRGLLRRLRDEGLTPRARGLGFVK